VLAIGFWDSGRPNTGVASIGASSIHTFTAESSQVLIGKCSNGAEGVGGRRVNEGEALCGDVIG